MRADQVLALVDALAVRELRVWLGGGWGVDAVAGRQTRPHRDLDLTVDADQLDDLLALLADLGFTAVEDWLPIRIELAATDARIVDVHPVVFAPDGRGQQAGPDGTSFEYAADGFSSGTIAGRRVPILSVAQQLRFRQGYELREVDHHDLAILRRHDACPEV